MRISTFNVENLFSRASAMNLETWAQGRGVLSDVDRLNTLMAGEEYTPAVKKAITGILEKYEFQNRNKRNRPFDIVQVHGKLFSIRKTGGLDITASGSGDWVGWVELARDKITHAGIQNTGRVISEVRADIQLLVEVEDRITLDDFNTQVLSEFDAAFSHNMLIDGNDRRGIDLGLLSRLPIVSVRSHIDDGGRWPVFSRDCPEFEIRLESGEPLWLLGNHFKSKGYGKTADSDKKRRRQAQEAARIYQEARQRSKYVIVAGDLNDSPDSEQLRPLMDTDLKEVMSHPSCQGLPGTYKTCKSLKQKIDYIFLSPALWEKVTNVGVERRGIYAPGTFEPFDTVTSERDAASDHAAVWVDLEI